MRPTALAVAALTAVALGSCSEQKRTWSANCDNFDSVSLDLVVRHNLPGSFAAWGLFFHRPFGPTIALYNDGYVMDPNSNGAGGGLTYAGWAYDGHSFSGPGPSDDYTPMPLGPPDKVTLFDPRAAVGSAPSGEAMYLNMFIDPSQMSASDFSVAKACIVKHRRDLNAALASLPSEVSPGVPEVWGHPAALALGGIAHERPPLDDPAFMKAASAKELPFSGYIQLYPGASATDEIGGHSVRITASPGEWSTEVFPKALTVEVDSKPVKTRSNGLTDVPGVKLTAGGAWTFFPPFCSPDAANCGTMIMVGVYRNSVGLETIQVLPECVKSSTRWCH